MEAEVFIATSLDGFIARLDGRLDWLPTDGGEPHGYDEFIQSIDAIVIGRGTFETVLGYESWPYETKPVFVLSSRLKSVDVPDGAVCELMAGDPAEIVARLSARGFRRIYVDGGDTIRRFLRRGLIQRLTITRVPILLGAGIPLFGQLDRDIRLDHVVTHSYPSGLVTSTYAVVR